MGAWTVGVAVAIVCTAAANASPRIVVDDFSDVSKWSAQPASGVELRISSDRGTHGTAMRLDFDFHGGGGYAVARRAVDLELPENYRFRFAVRGACGPNDLEFKLVDPSGDNVWWCNRRNFEFPAAWDTLVTRKRQVVFAWGPSNAPLRRVGAIEFAVTAGSGGHGTVWIDDLTIEPLPAPDTSRTAPRPSASSARRGHPAAAAIDGDPATRWESAAGERRPWVALDLGGLREYGALTIDWTPGLHPADYDVEASDDGASWRALRAVRGGNGGRDDLFLPESESRWLRVRALGRPRRGMGVAELRVRPLAWGASVTACFEAIARESPRGRYPRGMIGEQTYWTVVGLDDGGREEALLGEDGRLEVGKGAFSIEPFLRAGDTLLTWAHVQIDQRLEDGDLPMPIATWSHGDLELETRAFAVDDSDGFDAPVRALARGGTGVIARYRVTNRAAAPARATLYLALRPFQVNPPTQFLGTPGGAAPIRAIARDGAVVRAGDRSVASLSPVSSFGAAAYDHGDVVEFLRAGALPPSARVEDPFAHASGALAYALDLPARGTREVALFVPLAGPAPSPVPALDGAALDAAERACRARWTSHARGFALELPEPAADVARALRAQLGWILVNRDGAAIQPGSRAYDRSWIRDGSLTASALLRLGHEDVVREYLEWFAAHQYADGKVPCCIDRRGADPVPEHDSSGELIFAVAEVVRFTGDRAFAERMWPAVARAAAYLDSLRGLRRTAEWRTSAKREFFGLLPPSISHEGYSAKPMHSYWDDAFALRGFEDAAYLAGVLGRTRERSRLAAIAAQFRGDLGTSIRWAMARHRVDYVPGSADLGDFDATSTTIFLAPTGAAAAVTESAIRRTFERYWDFFRNRRDGREPWDAYTPYETRTIGAFVRLGWRERANELLDFFLSHRRPRGWQQWAEVVGRDPRTPRFIGDMPHTWVGSDFARSVLDMIAYERPDSALVIGAGVPLAWVRDGAGMSVRGLRTTHGVLSYSMRASGDTVTVRIEEGVRVPRGGIVVRAPSSRPIRRARLDDAPLPVGRDGEVVTRKLPATVVLSP